MSAGVFVAVVEIVHGGGDGPVPKVGGIEGGVKRGDCEKAGEGKYKTNNGSLGDGKVVS